MWKILLSNPELMVFFLFYMLGIVVVLVFATLTSYWEPPRSDDRPPVQADYEAFRSNGPRWAGGLSDRRFLPEQDSSFLESDRRLWPVQYWRTTVYARMFADASERIRL